MEEMRSEMQPVKSKVEISFHLILEAERFTNNKN